MCNVSHFFCYQRGLPRHIWREVGKQWFSWKILGLVWHKGARSSNIAQSKGIVSFSEANEFSIGPKAVRLHWPVLPDCWRSVELAEILIGICTVGALTALPDHLLRGPFKKTIESLTPVLSLFFSMLQTYLCASKKAQNIMCFHSYFHVPHIFQVIKLSRSHISPCFCQDLSDC